MDFIEHAFHVSPDHGCGTLELSLILIPVVIAVLLAAAHLGRRHVDRH